MSNFNITIFQKRFFSQKKAPAGKCTHGKNFKGNFSCKKGPCGKMQTRQKMFHIFFSGKGIFTYYKFSHLTTIFFIRKNSYFSDTRFLQCADFGKSPGKIFNIVMKPIWVRALRLIFSQVYITRPCLQFCRPPKISLKNSFWKFRISYFRFSSFTVQILAWTGKIWNTKFSKIWNSRNFGRPLEL